MYSNVFKFRQNFCLNEAIFRILKKSERSELLIYISIFKTQANQLRCRMGNRRNCNTAVILVFQKGAAGPLFSNLRSYP